MAQVASEKAVMIDFRILHRFESHLESLKAQTLQSNNGGIREELKRVSLKQKERNQIAMKYYLRALTAVDSASITKEQLNQAYRYVAVASLFTKEEDVLQWHLRFMVCGMLQHAYCSSIQDPIPHLQVTYHYAMIAADCPIREDMGPEIKQWGESTVQQLSGIVTLVPAAQQLLSQSKGSTDVLETICSTMHKAKLNDVKQGRDTTQMEKRRGHLERECLNALEEKCDT